MDSELKELAEVGRVILLIQARGFELVRKQNAGLGLDENDIGELRQCTENLKALLDELPLRFGGDRTGGDH